MYGYETYFHVSGFFKHSFEGELASDTFPYRYMCISSARSKQDGVTKLNDKVQQKGNWKSNILKPPNKEWLFEYTLPIQMNKTACIPEQKCVAKPKILNIFFSSVNQQQNVKGLQ